MNGSRVQCAFQNHENISVSRTVFLKSRCWDHVASNRSCFLVPCICLFWSPCHWDMHGRLVESIGTVCQWNSGDDVLRNLVDSHVYRWCLLFHFSGPNWRTWCVNILNCTTLVSIFFVFGKVFFFFLKNSECYHFTKFAFLQCHDIRKGKLRG